MPIGKLDHYSIRTLDIDPSNPQGRKAIELNCPASEAQRAA